MIQLRENLTSKQNLPRFTLFVTSQIAFFPRHETSLFDASIIASIYFKELFKLWLINCEILCTFLCLNNNVYEEEKPFTRKKAFN